MKREKKQARAENAVLELLKHHKKTGLSFKAILHSVNIPKVNRNSLRVLINTLISKGMVSRKGKGYRLASSVSKEELNVDQSQGFIEGKLSMHKSRCLIRQVSKQIITANQRNGFQILKCLCSRVCDQCCRKKYTIDVIYRWC